MPKIEQQDELTSHSEALNHSGMYVLMDEVTNESIKPVIEWLLYENYVVKTKKAELILMVCSEGGDLQSAFALIDVMRSSAIPIKTVGLGQIASSGLLIFMTGTKGRRVLTPNTSILSHQFSWSNEGKAHELFAAMKEFELTHQRMLDHYRCSTGQDDDTIKEYLLPAQDRWLSSADALRLGVCDVVSGHTHTTATEIDSTKLTKKVKTK